VEKEPKKLWREVITLWSIRHNINWKSSLWLAALLSLGLTIIGLITTQGIWQNVSWTVFGLILILELGSIFLELPAKVYKRDTESLTNTITEMLPLKQLSDYQHNNPIKFLSAKIECLMVEKDKTWVCLDIIIASRLPYPIEVKKVKVILSVPEHDGKYRYDMTTHIGEQVNPLSGEEGNPDLKLTVHLDNNLKLANRLLTFIGEHPCRYMPLIEGTVIITTNKQSEEYRLCIPETSVICKRIR
jgi:hypothetical protein